MNLKTSTSLKKTLDILSDTQGKLSRKKCYPNNFENIWVNYSRLTIQIMRQSLERLRAGTSVPLCT